MHQDLHPGAVTNAQMGLVFEELIRRFAELSGAPMPDEVTERLSEPLPGMLAGSNQNLLRILHYPPLDDLIVGRDGTVWIALAWPSGGFSRRFGFPGDRRAVRREHNREVPVLVVLGERRVLVDDLGQLLLGAADQAVTMRTNCTYRRC